MTLHLELNHGFSIQDETHFRLCVLKRSTHLQNVLHFLLHGSLFRKIKKKIFFPLTNKEKYGIMKKVSE